MSRWIPDEEFPQLLEAWRQTACKSVNLQQFLEDKDEPTRKEIIRDIYEFLHAQQLCAMSTQMQQISDNVKKLTEQPQRSIYVGLGLGCIIGGGLATLGMFFFGHIFQK